MILFFKVLYDFLDEFRYLNSYLLYFTIFSSFTMFGNNGIKKENNLDPVNNFDIIPVEVNVKGILHFETEVIITDSKILYFNVEDLFNKLGINVKIENNGNILSGFVENENKTYRIDIGNSQIIVGAKNIKSINGIVQKMNSIYVESNLLTEAFGLNIIFNFRSLSVKLDATFELPKIKQARLEKMRNNISKLQTNTENFKDTIVVRNYHLFKAGTLNWSASTFQTSQSGGANNFGLSLGSELLYGEANVSIFLNSQSEFDSRQLLYNWRWIDNEKKNIKQAQVGKVNSQSISFLKAPLLGASITNSSNAVRKAKGTFTISEYTEPNWTVELYINDALVDYTSADASGLYLFKVPIVYGYTTLKLKFYGLLGEERIEERVMNTPYTFMPVNVLEYNLVGGVLEDENSSQFGRGEVNYGLTRFLTIGGGLEYLSNIPEHTAIPFAHAAIQPFSKMVINMEYAHNVSIKGLVNYYLGSSSFLELDYRKYVEGQQATFNTANEERRVKFSFPSKLYAISTNTKLSYNQFIYNTFNYNQVNTVFSGNYKNYSANFSLTSNWISNSDVFLTSNLAMSFKMTNGLVIRPSIDYNFSSNQLMRYGTVLEKRVSKMSFSATIERNEQIETNNFLLNFKYDFNFARTYFSVSHNNNGFNSSQSAQGSLAFGGDNGYVKTGNNSALGKGGILLYPFLDLNNNGKKDVGEPTVFVKDVKMTNGKAITSERDSIVRISDLNSFVNYNIQFADAELESLSWRFKHHSYQVLVDPNQYKKVEVPILVVGEVSGMIYLHTADDLKGQGRITIQIYNDHNQKVAETLSESDGYYNYLGLKPGNYTIRVDDDQLDKLDYQSSPEEYDAFIKISEDGTIVDGLDFNIKAVEPAVPLEKAEIILTDTSKKASIMHKQSESHFNTSFGKILDQEGLFYSVQIGVFKNYVDSEHLLKFAPVFYEFLADGMIRYISGKFDLKNEAKAAKNKIIVKGVKDAYIVKYKSSKKIDTATIRN
ncbi:Copper amine oxidase N-terminal domain-containing protein [Flavobacterium gillisiae]|uniref:Copper amine oxidase N-terminal domain-containing protein n=1 Tax=Flavobacterium gillisiae TaxID=150146 RepID=A0A1H4G6H6_9FLAO|nr:carboxypeptidase-like regulatory domain-containing protein [Flavobacterium gillisiae]SEB04282.1 Copper amine oxidase N-terminal domain-containing protein [Flavobacterium gillisiae]